MALALAIALSGIAIAHGGDLVRAPDEIRSCLCREQAVRALDGQVQAESRVYEDKRQAFQSLDHQVQQRRPQVNVKSQADIDAFKRLLDERDRAADALAGDATKNYADAVARYNQAVAGYNGACAGKAYDPDQLAELRRALSCPNP